MNIAAAQSGGPTCAINASLAGIFSEAKMNKSINKVYGSLNGIEGIINERLIDMNDVLRSYDDMELLKRTPSTVLGSCRFKLPSYEEDSSVYEKITQVFEKYEIGAFFYMGGNDSMDTVCKLSRYFKDKNIDIMVIGIPKTIDNDLKHTDHTPGFGSAAKYLAVTLQEITRDSAVYNVPSVTIVEIMGRDAGWLTASSCVLHANDEESPHLIYLPEADFSDDKIIADIKDQLKRSNSVVVAVSEGVTSGDTYAAEEFQSGKADAFGHSYLSGIGKYLEKLVEERIGCKVRSIELNVMQRCSSHMASKTDIDEAFRIGSEGVKAAVAGKTGVMMAFVRTSNEPYFCSVTAVDANEVANQEKKLPHEWINDEGNNVRDEAIDYFLPLIQGELNPYMKNGVPVHMKLELEEDFDGED